MNKDMVKLQKRVFNSLRSRKAGDMVLFLFIFYWGVGAGCTLSIIMDSANPAIWVCILVTLLAISVAWIYELNRVGSIKE